MVRIGLVGVGFMGWIHWLGARRLKGAKVAAVVSRDPKKRKGDWRGVVLRVVVILAPFLSAELSTHVRALLAS